MSGWLSLILFFIFLSFQVNNRAKNKIYRIARSNNWDWFITLTFDRTKTDASDYDTVINKLQKLTTAENDILWGKGANFIDNNNTVVSANTFKKNKILLKVRK